MEKVIKPIRKKYLPVKIYIDDIEKIVSIFDSNNISYTLETDQFKFKSLSNLVESLNQKEIPKLQIQTDKPSITIDFNKMWASMDTYSNDTLTTGLFHNIDDVLKKTIRFFGFSYNFYFFWMINILFGVYSLNQESNSFTDLFDIPFVLLLIYTAKMLYIRMIKYSSIQLVRKEDKANFFIRKKDDLILGIIMAIIGAALTLLRVKYFD
jgi:hypothetical protein